MKLEICCYSIEDIKTALHHGVDRIEFCAGRSDGGLTPSYGDLLQLSQLNLPIAIHPIVRPRGGDFHYNQTEINTIINDIKLIRELNFAGVVFGALTPNGHLDLKTLAKSICAADGLSMTFHRAFDVCKDPFTTLDLLDDLGFDRLLTSGQQSIAINGLDLIQRLNERSKTITVMPGSGVKSHNLKQFIISGLTEFHSSATKTIPSPMQYLNPDVCMSHCQNDESIRYTLDIDEINKMKMIMANNGG